MGTITIGANTYQIHGTEPGIAAYAAAKLSIPQWTGAAPLDRKKAHVEASRAMQRMEHGRRRWTGEKTGGGAQILAWPRDGATCDGDPIPDGSTPQQIIDGEYEFTFAILGDPTILLQLSTGTLLKRAQAGEAGVEFFGPTFGTSLDLPVPPIVYQLFRCFLEGSTITAPPVTGNLTESSFAEAPSSPLERGWS